MGASPYTRERLEEAARGARSLSEALETLGVDTAHFEREGSRWTRKVLQAAVSASTSMNDVLRHVGLELVGGHHTHISRRIKAYGIDTSHFVPVVRTEKMRHNRRRRTAEEILIEDTSPHPRRVPSARLKRAMRELGVEERCAMCGIGAAWQGEQLPLEVDHIDGDWRNNRVENVRFLCPNCHSTTDSYRGRGSRRVRRRAS
ncbi:HNH endonuclease [Streptomyces sp. NPDC101110]|uniref:HNH endonuclease signature motif containing protein n=1 Tax=unclassified Streptomyces TaxID=2593676 RepID=UPI00382521E4